MESPDGGYVCCYSAFDGKASCLMVATSDDLVHWDKHGPAFGGTRHARRWSKSGAVVTEVHEGRLQGGPGRRAVPHVLGRGHVLHGDVRRPRALGAGRGWTGGRPLRDPGRCCASRDRWGCASIECTGARVLRPVLGPRPGRFDALLTEPGPPALLGPNGIALVYNGGALRPGGVTYQPGCAVFDPQEPGSVIARCLEASPPTRAGTPWRDRSTTSASLRVSCSTRVAGSSTWAWPTPGWATPPLRPFLRRMPLGPCRRDETRVPRATVPA